MEIIEKQNLRELIFNKISSLDIYGYYMPHPFSLNKLTNNPFVSKDKNPSFMISNRYGNITFIDFGDIPNKVKYNNTEELLKIDFVDEHTKHLGFSEFIVGSDVLIAKYKNGLKVTIGYIT